uniref:Uncharacterized protein n=1 Tax=Oryza brachyantha TaxID=4533 RepID=J3N4R8_ORYBR
MEFGPPRTPLPARARRPAAARRLERGQEGQEAVPAVTAGLPAGAARAEGLRHAVQIGGRAE